MDRRTLATCLMLVAGCASTTSPETPPDDASTPPEDLQGHPDDGVDAADGSPGNLDGGLDARTDLGVSVDGGLDVVSDLGGNPDGAGDARTDLGRDSPDVFALPRVPGVSLRDLYAFHGESTGSFTTEIHALAGATGFGDFSIHAATSLGLTGTAPGWTLLAHDFNRDGAPELCAIRSTDAGSGTTELHVLDAALGFRTFIAHAPTALPLYATDGSTQFLIADQNADGFPDVYAITHGTTGSGAAEVHVLDGGHNFDRFLVHAPTALGPSPGMSIVYALADLDHDAVPDLYAIVRNHTGSGHTEVHVLSGTDYRTFLVHTGTALAETGTANDWSFLVADANNDAVPDLYAVQREGTASGSVEVTILSGADHFSTTLMRTPVPLAPAGHDASWQFDLAHVESITPAFRAGDHRLVIPKAGGANGGGYTYAPSIVHDGGGYHLWACNFDGVHLGDSIVYAHSADGARWSSPTTVLWMPASLAHRLEHVCDPSVVRFAPPGDPGGRTFYYLFHSSNSFDGGPGGTYLATVNSVARALTPTGPFGHYMGGDPNDDRSWVVEPGSYPAFIQRPAVACGAGHEADCYGAGEPTVVLREGTLHLWYTDTTASPPGNYYTHSTDGVHWAAAVSTGVALGSVDVRWDPSTRRYLMVGLLGNHLPAPRFASTTSTDGVHWTPVREGAAMPAYASEVGFSATEQGFTDPGVTLFGFAAPYGLGTTETWGQWELFVSPAPVLRE